MDLTLSETEIRVLGSLVEKKISTPEYYPLSLNALTHACNQKTNRDPVVSYDDQMVLHALDSLREKKLVWVFKGVDSRVPKYGHIFPEAFDLNTPHAGDMVCCRRQHTLGRRNDIRWCCHNASPRQPELSQSVAARR